MTKKKLFIPIIAIALLIPIAYLLIQRYNHPVSPVTEETLDSLEVIELPEPDLL